MTTYARLLVPRGGVRSWWGKAWQRAVEEAAFTERDLKDGRLAARRGDVGGITVESGLLLAAVREGDDAWTARVACPVLEPEAREALAEVVAAESGRIASLLAGQLPHDLIEHAEEVGVELVPYGGELIADCTCPGAFDPCPHALALLVQAGWLVDADPLVLFALRGVGREALAVQPVVVDDVEVAVEAALAAQRLLSEVDAGAETHPEPGPETGTENGDSGDR